MKKLNRSNALRKSKQIDKGGDDDGSQKSTVKYACFPAVIKSPVICCPCEK